MKETYWENKTVVVSGGLGFIGSHFVEELALLGANVICLYRTVSKNGLPIYRNQENIRFIQVDLLDRSEVEAACKYSAAHIDCFIHCAALDGNTEYKLRYAAEILDTNNRLVSNVLNGCRSSNVKDVVLLSSTEIYSPNAPAKIKEEDDYHSYLGFTENGYVLSKVFSEMLAELHHKQYDMQIYTPRPTNVYGPRDSFSEKSNRVIPSMIRKVSHNEKIEIWGSGEQTRSFIYVKDLIHATLKSVEKNISGPMNVATKNQVSILDLATSISQEFHAENSVTLDKTKPTGVAARSLDVTKMYSLIDFEPLGLHEGLKQTIAWYRSNSTVPGDV